MAQKIKIFRKDLDGSTIEQHPCSLGYRVYHRGEFKSFFTKLDQAHRLLDSLQAHAAGRLHDHLTQ